MRAGSFLLAAHGLVAFSLIGCKSGGPVDASAPSCEIDSLTTLWPTEGLDPTSRSTAIQLSFNGEADPTLVSFTVEAEGQTQAGSVVLEGGGLAWKPEGDLPVGSEVQWSTEICGEVASGSFVTGEYGEAAVPDALDDQSWSLDLAAAKWVEPEGGGDLFASLFGGLILLGVQSATESQIDMIGGVGEVVTDEEVGDSWIQQDPCYATVDFPAASFMNNPYVEVGPADLALEVQGIPVTLHDVLISGALTEFGDRLAGATLSGETDARDLESMGSAATICGYLEMYGVSCVECTADGEPWCVRVGVEEIEGERQPGLRVQKNENPSDCG